MGKTLVVVIVILVLALAVGGYVAFFYDFQPDCEDSDGGLDYETYGTCIDRSGTMGEACFDPAPDGSRIFRDYEGVGGVQGTELSEQSCKRNVCRETVYRCPKGCINGACID